MIIASAPIGGFHVRLARLRLRLAKPPPDPPHRIETCAEWVMAAPQSTVTQRPVALERAQASRMRWMR